ncbi:hypothetical protein [Streptomyces sp. NPDC057718]|uniref:hypothetical protein n=1 Tax=Streptomyces sp. NPDC057718 TaxID=3346225 RepID=UPI00369FE3A2
MLCPRLMRAGAKDSQARVGRGPTITERIIIRICLIGGGLVLAVFGLVHALGMTD